MTSTANDTQTNEPAEAPLIWTSKKVWGSEGLTHNATTEINGERWTFTVDQPTKGRWVARAWRDGDFALHREDHTMKGAKQQAQGHANYAATSTCTECRKIGGHKLDCGTGLVADMAKDKARGTRITLRDEGAELLAADPDIIGTLPDGTPVVADHKTMADQRRYVDAHVTNEIGPAVLKQLDPAEADQLMAELEETFPHLAEWKRQTLGDQMRRAGQLLGDMAGRMAADMGPVVVSANEAVSRMVSAVERVKAARDRVQIRKDTCGCRTPLHTMNCGVGGRVRVVTKAGA